MRRERASAEPDRKAAKTGAATAKSAAKAAGDTRRSRRATLGSVVTPRPRVVGALEAVGQVTKVSVSMPATVVDAVREVAGHGQFSAYVSRAIERQLELDRLAELVTGIEETLGRPISDELMAQAEASWRAE